MDRLQKVRCLTELLAGDHGFHTKLYTRIILTSLNNGILCIFLPYWPWILYKKGSFPYYVSIPLSNFTVFGSCCHIHWISGLFSTDILSQSYSFRGLHESRKSTIARSTTLFKTMSFVYDDRMKPKEHLQIVEHHINIWRKSDNPTHHVSM